MPIGTRRRGQRNVPRQSGRPRPPPGVTPPDPRLDPDFLRWQAQYNPAGTVPEWMVFRWLERHGFKHGLDFVYQVPIAGGRAVIFGVVADFVLFEWIALFVNGVYFHYIRDPSQRVRDAMTYARLEGYGYTIVVALDVDILARIDATMQLALVGQELPGAREGISSAG